MMNELSEKSLISEIVLWMRTRVAPLNVQPYYSKGGWEGWVQVELAMWLTSRGYNVIRENRIYDYNYYRADLIINENVNPNNLIVIEIKCQSVLSTEKHVIEGFCNDVNRLESLIANNMNPYMFIFVIDQGLANILSRNYKYSEYDCYSSTEENSICMKFMYKKIRQK